MFRLYRITDFIINIMRWPVALLLLLILPTIVMSYQYFNYNSHNFYYFGGGIILYTISALAFGNEVRHSMQIIAHELTHTFFALITLHPVTHFRINPDGSGGSMALAGKGNWLIVLAPYFFPLFAFFYMLTFPLFIRIFGTEWLLYGILGYLTAYYWSTVISQVHLKQTDIIRSGYFFSAIIIISLNLLITGMIFAYCSRMWSGIYLYFRLINKISWQNLQWLLDFIG